MRAYKFKGAAQADHIFDILLNQRLYCAPWHVLNDPMEGAFVYSYGGEGEAKPASELARAVSKALTSLRVCSLSATLDSHLLWAHYADGFNGAAVEVDLPESSPDIQRVSYRGVFGHVGYAPSIRADFKAREVLLSKYQEWHYERKVRILSEDQWYRLDKPVRRLIAGHRLHPALFDALQIICERQGIGFRRVGIGDEGIDPDDVEPYGDRQQRHVT